MDNKTQRDIDTSSRDKILHNTNENFFVEAGAGSGKTTVLVERMVAMVEEGKDISKISAITFTKAAANEFYARFQKRLIERSNALTEENFKSNPFKLGNPTDETRKRCREALQNIDLAFMGTIDSFCNMVMSEHPTEGLIPSNSKVISDEEAEELYKREYTKILKNYYEDPELLEKANRFLAYFSYPESDFLEILKVLLAHRDCELVLPNKLIENLDDKYAQEKKTINKIVGVLCAHPDFIISSNADNEEKFRKAIWANRNTFKYKWEGNVSNLLKAFKNTFLGENFRLSLDPQVEQKLQEGIDYFELYTTGKVNKKPKHYIVGERIKDLVSEISSNKYQVGLEFVSAAKDKILETLKAEGKLTFNDYLVYLRNTLRTDAENGGKLIKHIYDRHQYFMIDEFQDTDPIQSEIFFYLAAKEIKPNWKECIPHKGSLFIVGDPKQSIYRFKNADVASFLNIKEMFSNPEVGEALSLYCNFRSTYTIRNWFNFTFEKMLVDSKDQAAYPQIPVDESEKKDGIFTGVYYYETAKKLGDWDPENLRVAEMILKLVDNDKYKILAKGSSEPRRLNWNDFMIITPSKDKLALFTQLFREKNIPYFVEGNIQFDECPSFEAVSLLYNAITNTNDNRYLYATLKSTLFNIKEKDLIEATTNKFVLSLNSDLEGSSISQKLKNALAKLKEFAAKSDSMTPSVLFAHLIENSNVYAKTGNKNMEYLHFALELIKSKESSKEIVSHADTTRFLEKLLFEKNDQERCPGLQKDGNQVHLANLHKVKGLEAPVVILTCPNSKSHQASFRIVREEGANKGYLFKVAVQDDKFVNTIIETSAFSDLEEEEKESIKAEKARLAYVAATRARNVLIMASNKTKDGQHSSNLWGDMINEKALDIDLALREDEVKNFENEAVDYEDLEKVENVLSNEEIKKSTYSIERPSSQVKSLSSPEDIEVSIKVTKQEDEKDDTLATLSGTMVHRMMELILNSKDKMAKQDMMEVISEENIDDNTPFDKDKMINMLNDVYDTLHNGGFKQTNGCVDDILDELLSAETYCEVPFTYKKDGIIWNGIIDLLYKKDDKWHIIDWKTNRSGEGLAEHYKGQLEAYIKACKTSSGIDVEDAKIYHINIQK